MCILEENRASAQMRRCADAGADHGGYRKCGGKGYDGMEKTLRKKLPVGVENFEKITTGGFYYIDKTMMIKDLLEQWGEVNLFTRPRRFGKSLNMSMLKSFFEIGGDPALFDGLKIAEETALCSEFMGSFPVISISLKDVDGADFEAARSVLCSVIAGEALRFYHLLKNSDRLNIVEQRQYDQLVHVDQGNSESFIMPDSVLMGSLKTLSVLLEKHYARKVIILIDEYDVPLAKAGEHGYYQQMVLLLRNLLQQALKTNESLYFAVLTGCLRVAKESIFTGLNNPKIMSVTTVRFDEYFGFTDEEVKTMLAYYGLEDKYQLIKDWYDGYHFGKADVYCPWDVISYCDELLDNQSAKPRNYWSNTSSNDVVRRFIESVGDGLAKSEMEALIAGEAVQKDIHEELTYDNLYSSAENLWSVLFMTGYLTYRGEPGRRRYSLVIPNMEIRDIFKEQIMAMFLEDTARNEKQVKDFCDAVKQGNAPEVERLFSDYLRRTISIRDTFVRKPLKENFYHGILLGLLGYKNDWYIRSNQEAGDGYADIVIEIENEGIGVIIEVKYAEKNRLETACREGLRQIREAGYSERLREDECHTILQYGIACYKKQCRVLVERAAEME